MWRFAPTPRNRSSVVTVQFVQDILGLIVAAVAVAAVLVQGGRIIERLDTIAAELKDVGSTVSDHASRLARVEGRIDASDDAQDAARFARKTG